MQHPMRDYVQILSKAITFGQTLQTEFLFTKKKKLRSMKDGMPPLRNHALISFRYFLGNLVFKISPDDFIM